MDLKECLARGYIKIMTPDIVLVHKEIKEAHHDLNSAKNASAIKDFKWSIIKSYYAMFHAGKALLFHLGYLEKKHIAILIVLEDLNKQGKLESKYVDDFNTALHTREDADYHYLYNEAVASHNIEIAQEFVNKMEELSQT